MNAEPVRDCVSTPTLLRSDRALGEVEDLLQAIRRMLSEGGAGAGTPARRILIAGALDDLRRRARKADPSIQTRTLLLEALNTLYEESAGDLFGDPNRSVKSLDRALGSVRAARAAVCSFVGQAIGFKSPALGR